VAMPLGIEIAGYIASVLVASTFYMKTMLPLRVFAISSNVAFIAYGYLGHLYPVLILHLFLFPLNIVPLYQIKRLTAHVREAVSSGFPLGWLAPYMRSTAYKKGAIIFNKGEPADKMLYVHSGKIRVTNMGAVAQTRFLEPGVVLGEIGIFAPERKRTATAIAEEDSYVYSIDEDKVIQLYFENPKLAFYLIKLITRRLIEDLPMAIEKAGVNK